MNSILTSEGIEVLTNVKSTLVKMGCAGMPVTLRSRWAPKRAGAKGTSMRRALRHRAQGLERGAPGLDLVDDVKQVATIVLGCQRV